MKKAKYNFIVEGAFLGIYKDLYDREDCSFFSRNRLLNPKGMDKPLLFLARCIDKVFKSNLKSKWSYKNILLEKDTCIILDACFIPRIDTEYFEKLKACEASLNLLLLDTINADTINIVRAKERIFNTKWDRVYTFDKEDADTFGWEYIGLNYYSKPSIRSSKVKHDAYFVGALKGNRDSLIVELFKGLRSAGASAIFDLLYYTDDQYENRECMDGLNYSKEWISYQNTVLKRTVSSNCIVEILQENQNCQSLRYFEAVAFNKKLLTNNKHIFELPFYNPEYMHYFESVEDVDFDWVKTREHIDYKYNNDFSPNKLYEQIKCDFETAVKKKTDDKGEQKHG